MDTSVQFSDIQKAGGYAMPAQTSTPASPPLPQYSQTYPGYPAPVVTQPMSSQMSSNNTTVVITGHQAPPARQMRDWSTGICGCFEDCPSCLFVAFCYECAVCSLLTDVNENPCLPCCVFNWITATRTKIRSQLGIQGSIFNDFCMECFCATCAICQMKREVKLAKLNGHVFF